MLFTIIFYLIVAVIIIMILLGLVHDNINILTYIFGKISELFKFVFYWIYGLGKWLHTGKRPPEMSLGGIKEWFFQAILIAIFSVSIWGYYHWMTDRFTLPGKKMALKIEIDNQTKKIRQMNVTIPPPTQSALTAEKKKLEEMEAKLAALMNIADNKKKASGLDNFMNTSMLTGIGILALGLFTQFNGFDIPIQPLSWPWPGYDSNNHKWSIIKVILKAAIGGTIFGLIGKYFDGSDKTTLRWIGALLGVLVGLGLNFRTSTRTLAYGMSSYFSILLKLFLVVVAILGLIWLILNFSILSTSLSVIFLLLSVGFMLFALYSFLSGNSTFRKYIRTNSLPRMIFYIIFIIPCIISALFEGFTTEFGKTPRYVYMILLMEAVVLGLYFLIPLFVRWLYLHRPLGSLLGRGSDINKRFSTLKTAIYKQEHKINILKGVIPGITWNEIWLPRIGTKLSSDYYKVMRNHLSDLGYTDHGTPMCPPNIENTYYTRFRHSLGLLPKCSLQSAINYIIKTQPIIVKEQAKYDKMSDIYEDVKYEKNNFNSIFDTKQLINKPISTDKLTQDKVNWHYANLKKGKSYNYVYSLSSWIYINQAATNTKYRNNLYSSLINYGDKPNISYKPDSKTLRITVQTGTEPHKVIYKTKTLPLQKWNNIVINFDGGTLDVFINNKLVATEKNIIPYISTDTISIGEEGGVSGGICNVVYYPDTLGKTKMDMFYNTLKIKKPPILPHIL